MCRLYVAKVFVCVVILMLFVVPEGFAADKPKGEILIWGWPAADKAFEAILEGFNKEYPDIKVTWEMNPGMAGGVRDSSSTALAAGEGLPDISMIEINDIDRFVVQGGLVDLLQKPYDAQLVLHKVRAVLDGQELSRA